MTNQITTELKEKFPDKEKDLHFKKPTATTISDSIYLYGMTIEQYREGKEIHSKFIDQLQQLIN
ncbi:hypothetical protein [Flavobacterium chungbukense]|uniref:Uncharacterized protein n=1 Tax=Flavobacterium chungbukense TaxID=877464 RepID=A0ABP7YJ99_9FLAO|nr:hypothetical protein [Flavobacterium chungbukense]MCC4920195.1 hypothetical protein [Flavobacterium chungbukense]